jgi:hypothetical protein
MVIDDFNVIGVVVDPVKTNTPLSVDTYTHLPFTIIFQHFKMIGIGNFQVRYADGGVKNLQFGLGPRNQVRRDSGMPVSMKNSFGHVVFKGFYQSSPRHIEQ